MSNTMPIAPAFVTKLIATIKPGLCSGLGATKVPGDMCVQEAVMYCKTNGSVINDQPACVHPVLRSFLIELNDSWWSSNQARAEGLKRLAIAQLGTNDDTFDYVRFVNAMALYAIRVNVPIALRAAASLHPDKYHQEALEAHAVKCSEVTELDAAAAAAADADAARAARAAAVAADAAAAAAAADAARAAARAAAAAAARAAAARAAAARAAARAAAAAAARAAAAAADAARAAAADSVLTSTANYALSVLVEMKTAGSEFLYLAD